MRGRYKTLRRLTSQQSDWAQAHGSKCDDDGYCIQLADNLFQPLHPETEQELRSGDGDELGASGKRGKCQALHSSSALACNVFDFWRDKPLDDLARAFEVPAGFASMSFERKFPNGISRYAPNLDVVFVQNDGDLFAVESKFTEPFRSSNKNLLKAAYFKSDVAWRNSGLPGCQHLAEELRDGLRQFKFLDAAQLLKHMLGLSKAGVGWQLCYLWFDCTDAESDAHRLEIQVFMHAIGDDARRFRALTYQTLYARLADSLRPQHSEYLGYLAQRYFSEISA